MFAMKQSLSWLLIGTAISVGAALTAEIAVAQTADIDPLEGLGTTDDDGSDFLGESLSPYELIHRAVLAPSMSSEEFLQQQNQAIDGAAQEFRLRQQELFRQQQTIEATDDLSVDSEDL